MIGMAMVPIFVSIFHFWCYNPVANFYPFLLAHVYHVAFQLVKKFLSLDVTVFFLVYMGKIVYEDSGSNKEGIRSQYSLGRNQGATMDTTQLLL